MDRLFKYAIVWKIELQTLQVFYQKSKRFFFAVEIKR